MNKLIDKILCIDCGGELRHLSSRLICKSCGRAYEVRGRVVIMLDEINSDAGQSTFQKRYYEVEYSNEENNKDFEWRKRARKRLLTYIPNSKNLTILDLGCGQGYLSLAMAKIGHKVIACDIALSGLLRAQKEAERMKIDKNTLFIAADIDKIRFKKSTFNFILLYAILEHVANDKKMIRKIIQFSKDRARYYILVPLSLRFVFPPFIPINMYSDHKVGHLRRYDLNSILKLFNKKRPKKVIGVVYTGHIVKFLGILLSVLGINKWEKTIEAIDERMTNKKIWATNITVIIDR